MSTPRTKAIAAALGGDVDNTMVRRILLSLVAVAAFALASPAVAAASSVGQINFIRNATSSFDGTLTGSTTAQRQWMNQTYWRMRSYPPFFDQALGWAPPADFYRDLYALYRDSSSDQALMQSHPAWVLRDPAGNRLFIPYDCNGGTCTQYAADIGNPDFRSWWISQARAQLKKGYAGLYIDDVNMEMRVANGAGEDVRPTDLERASRCPIQTGAAIWPSSPKLSEPRCRA